MIVKKLNMIILLFFTAGLAYSQIPKIKPYDFKQSACANAPGWNYITSIDKNESIRIQTNKNWKSNGQWFPPTGVKHFDGRHPFPKKNAMAIVFKIVENGYVSYETMCCNYKSGAPIEWTMAPKIWTFRASRDNTQISWMINDWQSGGLGDNSECIPLYITKNY